MNTETIQLCDEVEEFLKLKSKSTASNYRIGIRRFIPWFKKRHGEDKDFSHFLDMLEENEKLSRKERKRLAETELIDFIDFCARAMNDKNG